MMDTTEGNRTPIPKLNEEFTELENTMQELYLMRRVSNDLKSYKRMIKLKRYD